MACGGAKGCKIGLFRVKKRPEAISMASGFFFFVIRDLWSLSAVEDYVFPLLGLRKFFLITCFDILTIPL